MRHMRGAAACCLSAQVGPGTVLDPEIHRRHRGCPSSPPSRALKLIALTSALLALGQHLWVLFFELDLAFLSVENFTSAL